MTRTWSAPASRASAAFACVPTVVITVAPRALASWITNWPTPPAPAVRRTVVPSETGWVDRVR